MMLDLMVQSSFHVLLALLSITFNIPLHSLEKEEMKVCNQQENKALKRRTGQKQIKVKNLLFLAMALTTIWGLKIILSVAAA